MHAVFGGFASIDSENTGSVNSRDADTLRGELQQPPFQNELGTYESVSPNETSLDEGDISDQFWETFLGRSDRIKRKQQWLQLLEWPDNWSS